MRSIFTPGRFACGSWVASLVGRFACGEGCARVGSLVVGGEF